MLQTKSIIIKGKVQGVYFRASAKEQAVPLDITGFVENCRDGSVRIIATGSADNLARLLGWCRHGPPRASVSEVIESDLPYQSFGGFTILR